MNIISETGAKFGAGLKTGAVITAAGLSSRMSDFKPLLPYKDTTMVRFLVSLLRDAGAAPVVVVVGYRGNELRKHLEDMDVLLVENPQYAETEMFDSIKLGLQRLAGHCDRAAFVPVDVPDLSPALLQRVFHTEGSIVRPVYHGRPGHPVVMDAALIPEVCVYTGDRGFRGALESLGCGITEVEAENDGIYNDIDTIEDYQSLIGKERTRTLYIVRHGAVEFPGGEKLCIGRTDLPLSKTGRRQALQLQEYFHNKGIEAVYASPLRRARETAQLIAGGDIAVRIRDDLTEMYMGSWENQPLASLQKKLEDEAPGGETRYSALLRFSEAVNQIIAETSGDIVIVSHAGVICAYLSERMNTPLETSRGLRQPYCGLNIFEVRIGSSPKLREYGVRANQVPEETS
ncbi:MAG: histidine phosphatase family protein [Eubacteriales bacterium]|nr:histidine phosphatase family protein [Eubacteriales bacterium]